mmetsp:Transcript_4415/g.7284  ORF Transcript_4415/g.7284 Transcript_4415/m.7284 type:complete len:229 (+) Transcript_4415:1253-1939(+)
MQRRERVEVGREAVSGPRPHVARQAAAASGAAAANSPLADASGGRRGGRRRCGRCRDGCGRCGRHCRRRASRRCGGHHGWRGRHGLGERREEGPGRHERSIERDGGDRDPRARVVVLDFHRRQQRSSVVERGLLRLSLTGRRRRHRERRRDGPEHESVVDPVAENRFHVAARVELEAGAGGGRIAAVHAVRAELLRRLGAHLVGNGLRARLAVQKPGHRQAPTCARRL